MFAVVNPNFSFFMFYFFPKQMKVELSSVLVKFITTKYLLQRLFSLYLQQNIHLKNRGISERKFTEKERC